jgi:hypothetical protein
MTHAVRSTDNDRSKGAAENETPEGHPSDQPTRPDIHGNMSDQLPHRGREGEAEDLDEDNGTDFPEPGSNPEHSGQKSR